MKSFLSCLFLMACSLGAFAQDVKWETFRTDDGEVSVTMPAGCATQFHDPSGISVRNKNGDIYQLKEMRVISCIADQTLLNVEIYENERPAAALKALTHSLMLSEKGVAKGIYNIGHAALKGGGFSQYFNAGKKHLYIATIASRGGRNKAADTFAQSVDPLVGPRQTDPSEKVVPISSLKSIKPPVIDETVARNKTKASTATAAEDTDASNPTKIILLSIPKPAYTDAARTRKVGGRISMRVNFGADGQIDRFTVMKTLPDGLLREAVLAAMRIKYLPMEKDGKPQSTSQLIEYYFSNSAH